VARKYRVGIIGRTGKGGYGHGIDTVWKEVPERFEIVAVADEVPAGRDKAVAVAKAQRGYLDYREMLDKEKLDIVGVGPRWIDQHRDMLLAVAEKGCHVYMEKPFCRTPAEADEIVKAYETKHLKLAIAHQTHYSPSLEMAKKLLDGGEIGDLLEVRGRGKEDGRGGAEDTWVLGSHVMDLMRYFAGDPLWCFGTVAAGGKPVGKKDVQAGNEGIGPMAGDAIDAMYRFPKLVTGFFGSHRKMAGGPSRFGVMLYGSKGIMEFHTGYNTPGYILKDSSWSPGRTKKSWQTFSSNGIGKPETRPGSGLGGGNVAAVLDLVESIEKDRQPKCSMYEARWTIEMISAIFDSHRLGGPTTFPLATRTNPLTLLKT